MKYKGLMFYDLNDELEEGGYVVWYISNNTNCIQWRHSQWCVAATTTKDDGVEPTLFTLDETLFEGLKAFYTENKNVDETDFVKSKRRHDSA